MKNTEILQTIKSEARKIIPGCKVMLFGSRARGDYNNDSDYDILVITEKQLSIPEKRQLRNQIRRTLLKYEILSDILVQTESDIKIKIRLTGHIVKSAVNEGQIL